MFFPYPGGGGETRHFHVIKIPPIEHSATPSSGGCLLYLQKKTTSLVHSLARACVLFSFTLGLTPTAVGTTDVKKRGKYIHTHAYETKHGSFFLLYFASTHAETLHPVHVHLFVDCDITTPPLLICVRDGRSFDSTPSKSNK